MVPQVSGDVLPIGHGSPAWRASSKYVLIGMQCRASDLLAGKVALSFLYRAVDGVQRPVRARPRSCSGLHCWQKSALGQRPDHQTPGFDLLGSDRVGEVQRVRAIRARGDRQ